MIINKEANTILGTKNTKVILETKEGSKAYIIPTYNFNQITFTFINTNDLYMLEALLLHHGAELYYIKPINPYTL